MKADKVDTEKKLENWRKKKKKNRFLKGYLRQEETQEKNIGTEGNNGKKKDNIQIFPYRYKYIYIYILTTYIININIFLRTSKFNASRKHMNLLMLYR